MKTKINLIFITPTFYPATYYGGPIFSTYALAKALKRIGVDIKVITTNANGKDRLKIKTGIFYILDDYLPVKYYKSIDSKGTSFSMIFGLFKEIKNSNIVYLISVFSPPTPFTILFCKLLKKTLIISPRGQLGKWCLAQGSNLKKLWLKLFVTPFIKSFHWHLTSESEKEDLLSIYPKAKYFVIPNGVDENLSSIEIQNKNRKFYNKYSGFDCKDKKIIISMGRLQKVKGFDILIEAVDLINRKMIKEKIENIKEQWVKGVVPTGNTLEEENNGIILFIAGEDFGEKQNLINLISEKNLNDKIFLIGHIDGEEKINFLRNADVFALSSHHENFGMVYAEALATGTPIVASKNTPWQEVEKYNCGRWVNNSPDEFAEAIIEILSSDNVQMGENGIKFIKGKFSWNKIADEFIFKVTSIIN